MNKANKKINMDKVRNYPTVNEALDKDYGVVGTASREKFTEQTQAFISRIKSDSSPNIFFNF